MPIFIFNPTYKLKILKMSNELKATVSSFSDQRILNTLKQADNFQAEMVEMAKTVALERGLLTTEEVENYLQFAELKKIAERQIKQGMSESELITFLTVHHGVSPTVGKAIHSAASKHAEANFWENNKGAVTGGGLIIVLYVLIRIILYVLAEA